MVVMFTNGKQGEDEVVETIAGCSGDALTITFLPSLLPIVIGQRAAGSGHRDSPEHRTNSIVSLPQSTTSRTDSLHDIKTINLRHPQLRRLRVPTASPPPPPPRPPTMIPIPQP